MLYGKTYHSIPPKNIRFSSFDSTKTPQSDRNAYVDLDTDSKIFQAKYMVKSECLFNHVFVLVQDELSGRSLSKTGKKEYEVYLGIEDEEWDCTCGAKNMPCVHICAIAIAKNNTLNQKEDRTVTKAVGVRFVLLSSDDGLTLAVTNR